jgi:hypothetical protein
MSSLLRAAEQLRSLELRAPEMEGKDTHATETPTE